MAQPYLNLREPVYLQVNMDKWLKGPVAMDPGGGKEPANKRKKDAKPKPRQYSENYILYGFTSTSADPPQPQCFFCGEVLANNSMEPAHLQRHQSTKHSESVGKTEEFYKHKLSEFKSRKTVMMKATSVSSKALEASYAVGYLCSWRNQKSLTQLLKSSFSLQQRLWLKL